MCILCRRVDEPELTELLSALDEVVEPAADIGARFHARLQAHRATRNSIGPAPPWWRRIAPQGLPGRLAMGGALAAVVLAGVLLQNRRTVPLPPPGDIAIAEYLPLYEDMGLINNLELLEDFDDIEGMADHDTGAK